MAPVKMQHVTLTFVLEIDESKGTMYVDTLSGGIEIKGGEKTN